LKWKIAVNNTLLQGRITSRDIKTEAYDGHITIFVISRNTEEKKFFPNKNFGEKNSYLAKEFCCEAYCHCKKG
jgi:hypothetical protein